NNAAAPPPVYGYPPVYPPPNTSYPPPPPAGSHSPYLQQGGPAVPTYDQHEAETMKKGEPPMGYPAPPPDYAADTPAAATASSSDPNPTVPWGMEPSTEEMDQRFEGTSKGKFAILTGTNTVRCMGCGQNCVYKDPTVKFIRCPRCKQWTPRKHAKPINEDYEFVHCGGQCNVLLLVPKGVTVFKCPRERVVVGAKGKMGLQPKAR
ncbi:hypothetical protein SARC_10595, partial [Sphaeroforma arctica JP610]